MQRGIDNVFVLSGGLKLLGKKFPEGFTVGALPPSCVEAPLKGAGATARKPATAAGIPGAAGAGVRIAPLTQGNLRMIKDQLERNLLEEDASSMASTARSSTSRAGPRPPTTASSAAGTARRPPTTAERTGTAASSTSQRWK